MNLIKEKIEGKQIEVFTQSNKFTLANKKNRSKAITRE